MNAPPLYVGPGSVARCAAAHAARLSAKAAKVPLKQVAEEFGCTRSTLNAWADAHALMTQFTVKLARDGSPTMTVCAVVTPKGALAAAVAAFREYPGTLKGLELPGWKLLVGSQSFPLEDVREAAAPVRRAA